MAKEHLPVILSRTICGLCLSIHKVLYRCDNFSVIAAINRGSSRDTTVKHLLCSLWFFISYYHIDLVCEHMAGVVNSAVDHLFRHMYKLIIFYRIQML